MSIDANGVAGRFRVERGECTRCAACGAMAPEHFEVGDAGLTYVVYRQPTTTAEVALCTAALECCPVDAIHDQSPSSDGGTTTV